MSQIALRACRMQVLTLGAGAVLALSQIALCACRKQALTLGAGAVLAVLAAWAFAAVQPAADAGEGILPLVAGLAMAGALLFSSERAVHSKGSADSTRWASLCLLALVCGAHLPSAEALVRSKLPQSGAAAEPRHSEHPPWHDTAEGVDAQGLQVGHVPLHWQLAQPQGPQMSLREREQQIARFCARFAPHSGAICEQEVREKVLVASCTLEIPSFLGFGTPPGTHRRRAQDPGPAKTEGSAGPGSWARCLCTIS